MNETLWTPTAVRREASRMTAFTRFVEKRQQESFVDYESLWRWSIERPERFWSAVWEFCGVRASRPWQEVLSDGDRMPAARWFCGARLNYAENLLQGGDTQPAILFRNEAGTTRRLSFGELRTEVARIASWLRSVGISRGDRVAALMPNLPETVIMMLAAASIGAMFSSCSPDFGFDAVLERFGQIEPVVLIAADSYTYAGKVFDKLPQVGALADKISSLKHVLIVPYSGRSVEMTGLPEGRLWDELPPATGPLEFEPLPFDHPLYILYSSGTTGKPKCIVHSAGGTLLQHLKEHVLHTNLNEGERLFYFTTCGWMMWNWLASGLATKASIVLYDGAPMAPAADCLLKMADELDLHVFGTSASYLAALEKSGCKPASRYRLESLRAILSTGSPLSEESFDYVYRDIKADVCLSSISGGTDIISCFALGNPNLPVRRGELQCRGLGMAVDIFDAQGKAVMEEKGELVCTRPFPSMPLGFWHDEGNRRYRAAYFERFQNVWCHGDFALLTETGGMVIYGRSDAVLNPGGVRIGTAEIYAQVNSLDEIIDSLVIGQAWQGDVRIVLFVHLREGIVLDEALQKLISQRIRTGASPRHVPAKILSVPEIPKTRSGKIVEVAVRETVHGREVENLHALANPEALDAFRDRVELAS
jgi:acetoacetyl-CoA synthetase